MHLIHPPTVILHTDHQMCVSIQLCVHVLPWHKQPFTCLNLFFLPYGAGATMSGSVWTFVGLTVHIGLLPATESPLGRSITACLSYPPLEELDSLFLAFTIIIHALSIPVHLGMWYNCPIPCGQLYRWNAFSKEKFRLEDIGRYVHDIGKRGQMAPEDSSLLYHPPRGL